MKPVFERTPGSGGIALQPPGEADVRRHAIAWYARLCSGEATQADREAWQRWYQAHPDHQRAWQRLASMQTTLRRVPGHIAAPTLRTAQPERRRVLRGLAVLASGGSLAYLSWQVADTGDGQGGWRAWLADYRTGTGEQRAVRLADGSRLMLNTRTSADVAMDASHRLVTLRDGEILVETAKPQAPAARDARPFMVATPQGRILALGTRFTVRTQGERTAVTVLEDAVEIRAAQRPGQVVTLRAGQQLSFGTDGIGEPGPADAGAADWAQGSLVVNDWRLDEVVAELSRYRRGRLVCDAAVAGIRVSGAFPLDDTDKALAVLARAFPVRVSGMTRYWVSLVPA
ncbi:FecR domain-containing protein [Variovorax sp. GB4P3]|uniref:FecR domain-containing protein n=1 Tax=Variovorax sp. GB4P3 TaxID=3443738 RepID=UPI003F4526CF